MTNLMLKLKIGLITILKIEFREVHLQQYLLNTDLTNPDMVLQVFNIQLPSIDYRVHRLHLQVHRLQVHRLQVLRLQVLHQIMSPWPEKGND